MIVLLHIMQGIFAVMALGLLSGFAFSKHGGLLLAALAYGGAAVASFCLTAWWRLAVGFTLSWILRKAGFDPSPGG